MNKKGSFDDLKKIILTLLFGIILILFLYYISGGLGQSGDKSACKSWVTLRDSAKVAGIELAAIESPCVTSEETINKDDNSQEIKEELARSLYDCWDMYGKGEKDFFSDWDFLGSDTRCMICSEINVDNDVTKNIKVDLDEFEEYLSKHSAPGHGESYAEFILNAKNTKVDFGDGGYLDLEKGTPIYVMFVVNKRRAHSGQGVEGFFRDVGISFGKTLGTLVVGELAIPGVPKATGALVRKGVKIPYASGYKTTTVLVEETGQYTNIVTKSSKVVKGGWIAGGVLLIGTSLHFASDGSQLFPSLMLVNGGDIKDECDPPLYYNPKKELFEGFGGGSSGGGGAGSSTN
ncbi:MAG: hypothetical protein V1663_00025 [archaeon]